MNRVRDLVAKDVFAAGLDNVRKSWGWFLACGILLTILGVVCIGKAQTATTFSILALGWVLAFSGAVWLINSFYAFSWHGFFLYLLNAIIRGATGYLLIRHPDAGAQGVTMLLAALFIVGGLFRGIGASVIQFPRWGGMGVTFFERDQHHRFVSHHRIFVASEGTAGITDFHGLLLQGSHQFAEYVPQTRDVLLRLKPIYGR